MRLLPNQEGGTIRKIKMYENNISTPTIPESHTTTNKVAISVSQKMHKEIPIIVSLIKERSHQGNCTLRKNGYTKLEAESIKHLLSPHGYHVDIVKCVRTGGDCPTGIHDNGCIYWKYSHSVRYTYPGDYSYDEWKLHFERDRQICITWENPNQQHISDMMESIQTCPECRVKYKPFLIEKSPTKKRPIVLLCTGAILSILLYKYSQCAN